MWSAAVIGAGFHVRTAQCHPARVLRRRKGDASQAQSCSFSPETLLSHLFVFALIKALRAATETLLAFMRLMKVSAVGNGALLLCVRTHGSVNLQALPD